MADDIISKRLRWVDTAATVVVLAIVGATLAAGMVPMYRSVRRTEAETSRLQGELATLDGLSATLKQTEEELKNTYARLGKVETQLPSSGAMDQFMAELAKKADEAGMQVDAISPRAKRAEDAYQVMPVEITGSGTFDNCYKFLTGLRKMNRLTRLDDLVIQMESDSGGTAEKSVEHEVAARTQPVCRISVGIATFMTK